MMKLLIDECLTTRLVSVAHERNYPSSHVAHIGKSGTKDWHLMEFIKAGDWTLVTRNARDFRGEHGRVVTDGLYATEQLHAGLICLTGDVIDADDQVTMFTDLLNHLGPDCDLTNKRVEVFFDEDGTDIHVHEMP